MTALIVPGIAPLSGRARTEVLQWLAPAPLWDTLPVGAGATGLTRPFIAECTTDTFVEDFTEMLAGRLGTAADLADMTPEITVGEVAGAPYRLFQPLSQRYYLVTATLVCRRPGIPDHQVRPALEEKATFVMRRLTGTGSEEAFIAGPGGQGTWVAAGGALVAGEKEHPMHAAPVTPYALPGSNTATLGLDAATGTGRTVFFGYMPTGMREAMVRPMENPMQKLVDLQQSSPPGTWPDPIHSWLFARVIEPWRRLLPPLLPPPNIAYASLFLLLDLGDWLEQHLPNVHTAVVNGSSLSGAYGDLLDGLEDFDLTSTLNLREALRDTIPFKALVLGADIPGPGTNYNLKSTTSNLASFLGTGSGSLHKLTKDALAVAPKLPQLPPELEGMIKEPEVAPAGSPPGSGTTYVIRTVFNHAPCQPVLSEPTHPFELARALDADAPARKILLQMPDIRNMRKYKRGVAIEMPPALAKMMDKVTPEMLKGDGLGPGTGVSVGWICSFSLQIIFLVAFVVMFLFLLMLNFVFWWMAFLKICIPIPVPEKSQQGPQP